VHLDLNPKQMKAFYYAAKHLSLTRASEELFVTQQAVAMQLKCLEGYLGTPLFLRKNKRLELTEAGSLLYVYAERMMRAVLEAQEALDDMTRTRGILRIGTTKTLARYLMPSYILLFQQRRPEIHLQLSDGTSRELMEGVLSGRLDLAVVGRVDYDPNLDFMPIPGREADELLLIVAPEHPLCLLDAVGLNQLTDEGFILLTRGSGTRSTLERALDELGLKLNVILEAGNPDFIKDLVRKGLGVTVLSRISVEDDVRRETLAAVPFRDGGLHVELDVLFLRGGFRRPAISQFLAFLEDRPLLASESAFAST
jgi:DNA-binding transcriptional LysR family regulator